MISLIITGSHIWAAGEIVYKPYCLEVDGVEFAKAVLGEYDIVQVQELPEGFMPYTHEWDGDKIKRKPLTEEEKAVKRAAFLSAIDNTERQYLMNRGSREFDIALIEEKAPAIAAAKGITVAQVLALSPYYQKLKAVDNEITALRLKAAAV